jgi:signal transduction histidine kinase
VKKFILSFVVVALCLFVLSAKKTLAQEEEIDPYRSEDERFQEQSHYDLAIVNIDSVISLAIKSNNKVMLAYALMIKGERLADNSQYSMAKSMLKQTLQQQESLQVDSTKAGIEKQLSVIYQTEGKYDSALYFSNNAFDLYEKRQDTSNMIIVLVSRSKLHQTWGEYDQSLFCAMESYKLAKSSNNPEYYLSTVLTLGNAYEVLREYDTALACYNLAYTLASEQNDTKHISQSLAKQAFIWYNLKNYVNSKAKFIEAIENEKRLGNRVELAQLYSNISLVYIKFGQVQQAIIAAEKAVELSNQINHISHQTNALLNLGSIHKQTGNYTDAEKYYKEALELAEQSNAKKDLQTAYANLSFLYKETGDFEQALKYFEKYDVVKDTLLNEAKVKTIAALEARYESKEQEANILRLQNEAVKNEGQKNRMQRVQNITLIVSVFILLFFIWSLVFFRMKVKKNRIISVQRIKQLEDEKKLTAVRMVLVGQEEERKRVAQELHDGIGVLLSTARIHFSGLMHVANDKKSQKLLSNANEKLRQASVELRKISHAMMPGVLSKFGLQEALEDLFDELNDSGKIEITYTFYMPEKNMPEKTEIILYRVVQELINNTLQHAKADRIDFSMHRQMNRLEIDYADDGIGFDPEPQFKNKGLGLSGIYTRIDYLKGQIENKSSRGKGTSFKILINLDNNIN